MNTIPIIFKADSQFVGFGDDSQTGDALAYAFVIARRDDVEEIEKRINMLKDRFKIPQSVPLHCRVLFNQHPREKAGISHLSDADAHVIVDKAINIINKNGMYVRYAAANLADFKDVFTPDFTMTSAADGSESPFPAKLEPKGILGMLMQACCTELPAHINGPSIHESEIIASEDSTKIQFVGTGKKRADRHYEGFSDVGAPAGMVYELKPKVLTVASAPILQLADIMAYVCSHTFRNSSKDTRFKLHLSKIKRLITHTN